MTILHKLQFENIWAFNQKRSLKKKLDKNLYKLLNSYFNNLIKVLTFNQNIKNLQTFFYTLVESLLLYSSYIILSDITN